MPFSVREFGGVAGDAAQVLDRVLEDGGDDGHLKPFNNVERGRRSSGVSRVRVLEGAVGEVSLVRVEWLEVGG